ncbi:DUF4347 domain-containing protein [Nostoc sp.]|uniref:DUF4347 domain-containing protein n=1 Tax=Nostoc sp. TaxID=1180 RepID=UPI002FF85686
MSFELPRLGMSSNDVLSTGGLALLDEANLTTSLTGLGRSSQSLLFVDRSVADYQQLVAGATPGTEIHVLDPMQDAVTQITNTLLGRQNIASLHVVSHGEAGGLDFGSSALNLTDLPQYAAQLKTWSKALTNDADILFYGCNVAQGGVGQAFVQSISQLTGADVAASNNLTGKGGDWNLEVATGAIETSPIFSLDALKSYKGTLAYTLGARHAVSSGDVFLGGQFIELGVRGNAGFFGTASAKPANFFGTSARTNIGLSIDPDGYQTGNAFSYDVFLPGTPYEGWSIGYQQSGTTYSLQNAGGASTNITATTTADTSSGNTLAATVTSNTAQNVSVVQTYSFDYTQDYWKTAVTITNNSATAIDNLRYARGYDPDIAVDAGGGTTTTNTIVNTIASDGKVIISAEVPSSDPSFATYGARPSYYVSFDPSARAFLSPSLFSPDINSLSVGAKGATVTADNGVALWFDVGALAAGASKTVQFYGGLSTDILAAAANAPINTVPSTQTTNENTSLTLGGSNAISVADPDSTNLTVTLTAANGSTSLSGINGLSFASGDGTADSTMTFSGTKTAINTALNNLVFNPTTGFSGAASIQIQTSDGSFSDGDTISITVNAINNDAPTVAAPAAIAITEDVASALTGIVFADIDAESGDESATFTVGAGILAATSANGVTVGGTATNLTLNGTIAAINSFITGNKLTYTTPLNATSAQTLGVSINDGGNTGSGGALTSAVTNVALNVTAVNDPPTVTAPAAIATTEDVASALTGIVFADVDAGSGAVTATLTVGAGTLAASTGSGVTVGGTATNLTLSGTITAINSFIAGNSLTYTTALNATAAQTLSVSINDGGNTGSGGAQTSAVTNVALNVTAVNDPPTVTAPAAIATTEDVASALTGIVFADVDAGSGAVTATLTVGAGTLAASTGSGVTVGGTATNLTLSGTITAINSFIAGNSLTYTTALNATAAQTLSVSINDGGNTGSGGAQTSAVTNVALNVTAVNDAPSLSGNATLTAVLQNTTNPSGSTITNLFNSLFSDPDTGASLSGLAIVGNTANITTQGRWEYSIDGTTWASVGAVADGATGLALSANTLVRFVPVTGYNGTPPSLTVRALDNSYNGGFTTATTPVTVNTTSNGGATAIASTTVTIDTSVSLLSNLVWRNSSTGENAVWQLKGDFTLQTAYFLPMVTEPGWQIVSTADFNHDGIADILWRNQVNGSNVIWQMNSTGYESSHFITQVPDQNWQIVSTADFNSDGTPDILWRNKASGENTIWEMKSDFTLQASHFFTQIPDQNWQIVSTAKFNSDGTPDILWRNKASGENAIWEMKSDFTLQAGHFFTQVPDQNWQIVTTANFNSDGTPDILWRNKASGENAIWEMKSDFTLQTGHFIPQVPDQNWQIAGTDDFNGDGTPDILWRNKQTAKEDIWQMSGFSYAQRYPLVDVTDPNWSVKPFVAA